MGTKEELDKAFAAITGQIVRIEGESATRDLQLAEANLTLADQVSRLAQRLDALEQAPPEPAPEPEPEPEPLATPQRPFSPDSQWNLRIAPGARRELDAASQRLRDWKAHGRNINIGRRDYTIGVFQAEYSDPLVEVLVQSPDANNPGKVGRVKIHMPEAARRSPGTDGHCTIVDPSRRILHEFWWLSEDRRRAGSYVPVPVDSTGFGFGFGEGGWAIPGMLGWGSCRAYGGSSTAGLIRAGELEHGIEHMLMIAAPDADMVSPWIFPATRDDGGRHYGPGGTVPMGTIFTLPEDFDPARRGYSRQVANIAIATRDRGLFVGDKAGRNWHMYLELGCEAELESAVRWRDELGDMLTHVVTLKDNTPLSPKGWTE